MKVSADSIARERGDSLMLGEHPSSLVGDDDDTTGANQVSDTREPSHLLKDKSLNISDSNYGNDVLVDKFRHQDPQRSLRGNMGFKPRVIKKEKKVAAKSDLISVGEVRKVDPKIADIMVAKGVKNLRRAAFEEKYADLMKKRARAVLKSKYSDNSQQELIKKATHNYRMSDSLVDKEGGLVNYYDNWDVEWTLYKAKDHHFKGSRLGVYKSANDARISAQAKGDGEYVIEGEAIRDGSYWGYYVVAVEDNKSTKYAKLYVRDKESGVTHEDTYSGKKTAMKKEAVLATITAAKFLSDSALAGRYVRARLTKRGSKALASLYRAGDKVLDEIAVGKKQFDQPEDRSAMRSILETIETQFGRLKSILDLMGPDDQDEMMGLESAEEMSGLDLDGDMEMGEDPDHVSKVMGPASPVELAHEAPEPDLGGSMSVEVIGDLDESGDEGPGVDLDEPVKSDKGSTEDKKEDSDESGAPKPPKKEKSESDDKEEKDEPKEDKKDKKDDDKVVEAIKLFAQLNDKERKKVASFLKL